LDTLEEEREYLVEMCPADMRDTYEDGKEVTLVRLILRHLPAEYDAAVSRARDLARLRKYSEGDELGAITNLEDNTRINYASDWMPDYQELRTELLNSYHLQSRRRKEQGRTPGKRVGHPTMPILDGFDQPGPSAGACFRCGQKDHRASDPTCKGKEGKFQKDAPEWFKRKAGEKKGTGNGKGKGKGKGKKNGNRNWKGKGAGGDSGKPPCANYSKGNGYCKWGDNCRFSLRVARGRQRQWQPKSPQRSKRSR
jgi:hypothetical protein